MSEFQTVKEPSGVAIYKGSARIGRSRTMRSASNMIASYRRGRWAALHSIAMTGDHPDNETAALLRDWLQLTRGEI